MAWNDSPPTKEELAGNNKRHDWTVAAPSKEELEGSTEAPSQVSSLEALLRGAGQGGSFGLSDELTGALTGSPTGAAKQAANLLGADFSDQDVLEYKKARDEARLANQQAQEEHPYMFGAGQLGGGLASSLATGGLASAATGAELGTAGIAALGTGEGAVTGAGLSTAENGTDVAKEAAGGAALGAVLPSATRALGTTGVGALTGAGMGLAHTDENASVGEKLKNTAKGAILGGLAGKVIPTVLAKGAEITGLDTPVQNIAKQYEMGTEGIDTTSAAGKNQILNASTSAKKALSEGLLTAEENAADQLEGAKLNTQGKLYKQAFQENEDIEQARASMEQARRQAAQELEEAASKQKENITQAKQTIKDLQTNLAEQIKEENVSLKNANIAQASQEVAEKGKQISQFVENERNKAGQLIDAGYKLLEDQPVSINITKPIDSLVAGIAEASEKGSLSPDAKKYADVIKNTFDNVNRDLNPIDFRDLLQKLKSEAYTGPRNPELLNIQRLLKNTYTELNATATEQLEKQGFGDVANQIRSANKNYSTIFQIENKIGRLTKAEADIGTRGARKFVSQIANIDPVNTPEIEKTLNLIQSINPDAAQSVISEARLASSKLLNAGQRDFTTIKTLVQNRLEQMAGQNPELAQTLELSQAKLPKIGAEQIESKLQQNALTDKNLQELQKTSQRTPLNVSNDLINSETEKLINSEPALKQAQELKNVISDLKAKIGSQERITSLEDITPSSGLDKLFGPAKTSEIQNLQDQAKELIKKALPETGQALLEQAEKAAANEKALGITDTASHGRTLLSRLAGTPEKALAKGANLIGLAKKAVSNTPQKLSAHLAQYTPEQFQQLAGEIQNGSYGTNSQKFVTLLKQISVTTDPIKRNASLFMLHQDPDFRKIFIGGKDNGGQ